MSVVPAHVLNDDPTAAKKPDQEADSTLVRRCLQGDQQSFRQLYRRHQQRVRATLYQLCGASCLDDLVQEVFMRAWNVCPSCGKHPNFPPGFIALAGT